MSTIEKALDQLGQQKARSSSHRDRDRVHRGSGRGRHSANIQSEMIEISIDALIAKGMLAPGNGRSQIAEEYRNIKRPLLKQVLSVDDYTSSNSNLIMVSSALPGEGKTFTSINLAMSIAMELDHTCLLVDADVARPSVMPALGLTRGKPGLVDYLLNKSDDLSTYLLATNVPALSILPAGRSYTHATELLASGDMRGLMQELSERYHDRIIIFDTPPLLPTTESRVLATLMGQIVIVVEASKTQKTTIKQAISLLEGQQNISLVLNKNRKEGGHDYYYYGYGKQNENADENEK